MSWKKFLKPTKRRILIIFLSTVVLGFWWWLWRLITIYDFNFGESIGDLIVGLLTGIPIGYILSVLDVWVKKK